MFLEIPQNSQENTCARVSFLIKYFKLLQIKTFLENFQKLVNSREIIYLNTSLINCVPYVLTYQLALRVYVLACQRVLWVCVLTCQRVSCLRANVPMWFAWLLTRVSKSFACFCTHMSRCPACSRAHVLACFKRSCVNVFCVPTCSRAITSNNKYKFSMTCFP